VVLFEFEFKHEAFRLLSPVRAMNGGVASPERWRETLSVVASRPRQTLARQAEEERSRLARRMTVSIVESVDGVVQCVSLVNVEDVGEGFEVEEVSRRESKDEARVLCNECVSGRGEQEGARRTGRKKRGKASERTSETC
jgi:hypothetical protein